MSFKEILEKYKNGTATPEEIKAVEEELEKFEALNDFAYEQIEESIKEFETDSPAADTLPEDACSRAASSENSADICIPAPQDNKNAGCTAPKDESVKFAKAIKKEIKKTFLRIGAGSAACCLAIVLFIAFGLSPLMNAIFYNPTDPVWETESETDYSPDRLTLDFSIYTELMTPLNKYDSTNSMKQGFGNYYFTASKSVWRPGTDDNRIISGQIHRGTMQIFTPGILDGVSDNAMGLTHDQNQENVLYGMTPEEAINDVKDLKSKETVKAYITFNHDLTSEQSQALCDKYDIYGAWMGVRLPNNQMGYGYSTDLSGVVYENCVINDEYPDLIFDSDEDSDSLTDQDYAEYYRRHFVSMIRYMTDNPEFIEMLSSGKTLPASTPDEIETYIQKHGFKSYGMAIYADKAKLLKLYEDKNVYGILIETD